MSIFFKARERPQFLLLNFALNKLIHIKNYVVGKKKKKKKVGREQKKFHLDSLSHFQLHEHGTAGAAQG